ncbi:hypothetical protein TrVGV298_010327 [Trichoderma virens]|nr:hypothetical protein TrVGV298_010327 [Trichoderma virens]
MSAAGVSKRGKGRPRKEVNAIDSAVKVQREKNRQAQSLFRARRRATEVENELRISQLEKTVERMGDTFLTLVNHVVRSNQKRKDLELAERLQESINTFLTLAASSSDQGGDSINTRNHGDIRQPTLQGVRNPGNEERAGLAAFVEDTSSSQQVSASSAWNPQNSGKLWNLRDQFDPPPFMFSERIGPPANLLGNGWTGGLPFPHKSTLGQAVGHPVTQSMSTLIIQATLYYVYYILLEANDPSRSDAAMSIFRYALKSHSRDELLSNIRWFLGPGQRETYRLGIAEFQILNTQGRDKFPMLNPAVYSHALSDIWVQKQHSSSLDQTLLNASGVESYLLQRGLRRITHDILEIDLEQHDSYREVQPETKSTRTPNLINANVFFPTVPEGGSRVAAIPTQRAHTTRTQFLRAKPEGKSAIVLNVSSRAAHMRFPRHGWSGYSGSKLGQARIFEHIRFKHPEVRFINYHPGSVQSDGFIRSGASQPQLA